LTFTNTGKNKKTLPVISEKDLNSLTKNSDQTKKFCYLTVLRQSFFFLHGLGGRFRSYGGHLLAVHLTVCLPAAETTTQLRRTPACCLLYGLLARCVSPPACSSDALIHSRHASNECFSL